jgi:hypothetical protein
MDQSRSMLMKRKKRLLLISIAAFAGAVLTFLWTIYRGYMSNWDPAGPTRTETYADKDFYPADGLELVWLCRLYSNRWLTMAEVVLEGGRQMGVDNWMGGTREESLARQRDAMTRIPKPPWWSVGAAPAAKQPLSMRKKTIVEHAVGWPMRAVIWRRPVGWFGSYRYYQLRADPRSWFQLARYAIATYPDKIEIKWDAVAANIAIHMAGWWVVISTSIFAKWLLMRPSRSGAVPRCPNCGYSLLGLSSKQVCPECGQSTR